MDKKKLMFLAIGLAILVVFSGGASLFLLSGGNNDSLSNKTRVACVGDSITNGTYYPGDLWMMFGVENYTIGNFGVDGSAVSLDSGNPYMYTSKFQQAKHFQPNIVVIMLGTNDANSIITPNNGSFVSSYVKLVEDFQALSTQPKIWLVKPPPVFSNGTTPSAELLNNHILPGIEQVALQTNSPIIDVYSAVSNSSHFFPDGVHPDPDGSQLIANEIYREITAPS
jgi:lysophospholipase L1-like esterase